MSPGIQPEYDGTSDNVSTAFRRERGSLLIAAVFVLFLLFLIAGLAVDMSRYYFSKENVQNVADGAAMAGARALGQFHYNDKIDTGKVRKAVLDYIRANQGEEYADLYKTEQDGEINGIHVAKFEPSDDGTEQCVDFTVNDGKFSTNQPTFFKPRVLGSALASERNGIDGYQDSERWPVTTRFEITDENGNTTDTDPWGGYQSPGADFSDGGGNVNYVGADNDLEPANLRLSPGEELTIQAKSWEDRTCTTNCSKHQEVNSDEDEAFVFRDGDRAPGFDGYENQSGANEIIEPYLNDNNIVTLKENQAIIFFELWTRDPSQDTYDKQDFVILVNMEPTGGSGGGGVGSGSPPTITEDGAPCGNNQPFYRVGVQSYENFEPLFLPESVFGHQNRGIIQQSVAQVRPHFVQQFDRRPMKCTIYSGGTFDVQTELATQGGVCLGGPMTVSNQTNSGTSTVLARVAWPESQSFNPPSAWTVKEKYPYRGSRTIPSMTADMRPPTGDYVDMSRQGSWETDDCPSGTEMETRSGDDPIVWESSGDPVCVQGGTPFQIINPDGNSGSVINQNDPGSPVMIYSPTSLRVTVPIEMDGGFVSEQDLTLNAGRYSLDGHPNAMGGVVLWAGGDLTMNGMDYSTFEGIVGADNDVTIGTACGSSPPCAPIVEGKLIAGGNLTLITDGTFNVLRDRSDFTVAALDKAGEETDWRFKSQKYMGDKIPPFSQAQIRLLPTPKDINDFGSSS